MNYYQFSVSTTGQVDVETYAQQLGSALDTKLTLLDATGKVITTNNDAVGTDSQIIVTLDPGTYFAAVQGSSNTLGNYAVHFTALAAPAPQIVGISPGQTIGVSPNPLVVQLSVDNGAINPATVIPAAFSLAIMGPGDTPLPGVVGQVSAASYDASTGTINVTIVALDSSSQPLANLPSGIYDLTAKGTGPNAIASTTGVALAGGDYTGSFTVVAQPPTATLAETGVAGGNAQGVLFQFSGSIGQVFPAAAGAPVRIDLDTQGNGLFEDGSITVNPSSTDPFYTITATTPIAVGQSSAVVSARFTDAEGNVSIVSTTVRTDLPLVTAINSSGGDVNVSFSMPISTLQNVLDTANYQIAGVKPLAVVFDSSDSSGRTVTLIPASSLADGLYGVTVSGAIATLGGLALDGSGTGNPGSEFTGSVLFDRVPPQILSVALAPSSDSGVTGDNLTNDSMPVLQVQVSDIFPTGSPGTLTILASGDSSGFNDGQAQVTLTGSGVPVTVDLQLLRPLASGTDTIQLEAIDAAGNVTTASLTVTIDSTGAVVTSSSATRASGGLMFSLTFDKDLDPAAATNLANYSLLEAASSSSFFAGNVVDRTTAIPASNITYTPASAALGTPATLTVLANLSTNGADDGFYELAVSPAALVDLAGNQPLAGGATLLASYDTTGPVVTGVQAAAPLAGQPADTIVVSFAAKELDASTASNPANYQLDLVTTTGTTPVALAAPEFSADGYDTLLHLAGSTASNYLPVPAGQYQLTVQDLTSADGTPMAGGGATIDFTVGASGSPSSSALLNGNAAAINNASAQMLWEATNYEKQMTSTEFATQLLGDVQLTIAGTTGTSAQVATAVNQTITNAFLAREDQLAFNPQEYVVVWSNNSRFLLQLPGDNASLPDAQRSWIGYQANGVEVLSGVSGAVMVSGNSTGIDGLPNVSLAIVPVDALSAVQTTSSLFTVSTPGVSAQPNLTFHLDLQGLATTNQAGLVAFGQAAAPAAYAFNNIGSQTVVQAVNLAAAVTGLSPLASLLNEQVLSDIQQVFGNLSVSAQDLVVAWFDPVDFVLTDSQGNQVGSVAGQTVNTIPGAYLATGSTADLLVIPVSAAGEYNLALIGVGSNFNGALNSLSGNSVTTVPLSGDLPSNENLVAVLDFRQAGELTPVTSLPASSTPGTPSLASVAVLGIGQVLTPTFGLAIGPLRTAAVTAAIGPLQFFVPGLSVGTSQPLTTDLLEVEQSATVKLAATADGSLSATFTLPANVDRLNVAVVDDDHVQPAATPLLVDIRLNNQDDGGRLVLTFRDGPGGQQNIGRLSLRWAGPNGKWNDADDQAIELGQPKVVRQADRQELHFKAQRFQPGNYRLLIVPVPAAALGPDRARPTLRQDRQRSCRQRQGRLTVRKRENLGSPNSTTSGNNARRSYDSPRHRPPKIDGRSWMPGSKRPRNGWTARSRCAWK